MSAPAADSTGVAGEDPGEQRWIVSDRNRRSALFTTPLVLAALVLESYGLAPVWLAAGVPAGPLFSYVQNVVIDDEGRRGLFLIGAVGAFALLAIYGDLGDAMWFVVGLNLGTLAAAAVERRVRT